MSATPVWDAYAADYARHDEDWTLARHTADAALEPWQTFAELTRTARRGPSKADGVLIPTRRPLPPSATPIDWRGAL